jgi:hypothetical protein
VDQPSDPEKTKNAFLIMLFGVTIFSGIRQILRNRVAGDLDFLNVFITAALTLSFYPLLYISYNFAYKGTEEKEATVVLRSIALVGQLAIVRDLLYSIFALLEYRLDIFQQDIDIERTDVSNIAFFVLEAVLWWLTIIYLMPLVMARLKAKTEDSQKSYTTPFLLSAVIFCITWLFNFIIIRIFIELPLGREIFD